MSIKKNYIVSKRNVLNELRANSMSLQELRFFSIYLSKINPGDLNTRIVRFPLLDFQKIMELDSRIKIDYMKHVTNSLLCKVVNIRKDTGGYEAFQLFKECTVDIDVNGEWYVEINAHDKSLPLMFEFKDKYFTYQLWNALRLKSSNQLRMYEILKQYEKIGERILSVEELKELLGIDKNDYQRFSNFKIRVLDGCQEALRQHTDIKFIYEPTGKKGPGGKILYLKFIIQKNINYIDQLSLDEFINYQSDELNILNPLDDRLDFLSSACNDEFNRVELQIIYDLLIQLLPTHILKNETEIYLYLKRYYDELNWRGETTSINKRFNYFKAMLQKQLEIVE